MDQWLCQSLLSYYLLAKPHAMTHSFPKITVEVSYV